MFAIELNSGVLGTAALVLALGLGSGASWANPVARVEDGVTFQPNSNSALLRPGVKHMRTFLRIKTPKVGPLNHVNPSYVGSPPASGYYVETPSSLECVYQITTRTYGCDPNQVTMTADGGKKMIAIVDAFDYSKVTADLSAFSAQFGLPAPSATNFDRINLGSVAGNGDGTGWDMEAALDIQYAHAMAPRAKIVLVEAVSDSDVDLFNAVTYAANLVKNAGGGQVSMSWGGAEYSAETGFDSYMATPSVVYYAASGDTSGTSYPCTSPNVVCVGGTAHSRNAQTFAIETQWPWVDEGGGTSPYEKAPAYQSKLTGSGGYRMAPDVAAIADPNNSVWVYNSTYYGSPTWFNVGGTSLATPVTAGLDNHVGNFQASSFQYLTYLYGDAAGVARGNVTAGYCGVAYGFVATKGWNVCAGWGVPKWHVLP
jgi:kumamolisin